MPTEIQAAREQTATATQRLVRGFGFKGAKVEIVRRGGEARVAIVISLEVADALDAHTLRALARAGPKVARTRPELFPPLCAAGWKLRGSG